MNRVKEIEDAFLTDLFDKLKNELEFITTKNDSVVYSDEVIQLYTDIYSDISELLNCGNINLTKEVNKAMTHVLDFKTINLTWLLTSKLNYSAVKVLEGILYEEQVLIYEFKKNHDKGLTYFISGHRDITQEEFDKYYKPSILKVVDTDYTCKFVVGDYHGVDTMAQQLLSDLCNERPHKIKPRDVTVYHMFEKPRNFVNEKFNLSGGYTSDEERDAAMTNNSDEDIAFVRKGKYKSGTAQNIVRRHTFE